MDREMALIVACGMAVLLALGAFVSVMVTKERTKAASWCEPRGYVARPVKGTQFCVDPKTRIVYYPET